MPLSSPSPRTLFLRAFFFLVALALLGGLGLFLFFSAKHPPESAARPPAALPPAPPRPVAQAQPVRPAKPAAPDLAHRLRQLLSASLGSENAPHAALLQFCQEMTLDTLSDYLALLQEPGLDTFGYDIPARLNFFIHQRWLQLDGKAAADHALTTWSPDEKRNLLNDLFSTWSEIQPAAALDYYRTVRDDPSLAPDSLVALLQGAGGDFPFFCQELSRLPPSDFRNTALNQALNRLLEHESIDRIVSMAESSGDRKLINEVMFHVLTTSINEDPHLIPHLTGFLQSTESGQQDLRQVIFQKWTSTAPEEAAAWLEGAAPTIPMPSLQRYYQMMLNAGAAANSGTTERWLTQQNNDGRFDLAIATMAQRLRSVDNTRATEWLAQIRDPVIREQTMTRLARDAYAEANPPDH